MGEFGLLRHWTNRVSAASLLWVYFGLLPRQRNSRLMITQVQVIPVQETTTFITLEALELVYFGFTLVGWNALTHSRISAASVL